MKLHLIDGSVVEVFRQTCGHYVVDKYRGDSCAWNIDPVALLQDKDRGYFVIGKWGCDGYHDNLRGVYVRTPEKFEQLIPIHSVVKITEVGKWEKPRIK